MNVLIHRGVAMMSFEQDRGVWSDARMFDVAKGVLVAARRCGLDEALTELVGTAERHHMRVFAVSRALVALAAEDSGCGDPDATAAARATWGHLFNRPSTP